MATSSSSSSSEATQLKLPPGYRFVPEDKELVGRYLVPRLLGYRFGPNEILDVDPLSARPAQLLRAHGRKNRGQDAFFFADGQAKDGRGSRQRRTCAGGGMWQGQTTLVADEWLPVRVPGGVVVVQWRKKSFNFHEDKSAGSTGWVMHEYAVTAPPDLAASLLRVYRIRCSGHGKNAKKRKRGQALDSDEEEEDVPAHARPNTQTQQQGDVGGEGNAAAPPFVAVGEHPLADPSKGNLPPDATDGRAGIAEVLDTKEVDLQIFLDGLVDNAPIVDIPEF